MCGATSLETSHWIQGRISVFIYFPEMYTVPFCPHQSHKGGLQTIYNKITSLKSTENNLSQTKYTYKN